MSVLTKKSSSAWLKLTFVVGVVLWGWFYTAYADEQPASPESPIVVDAPEAPDALHDENHHKNMHHGLEQQMENYVEEFMVPEFNIETDGVEKGIESGIIVAIIAISFLFGSPLLVIILILVLIFRRKSRREEVQKENVARLIDAGKDVPIELLRGDDQRSAVGDENLRKGIKNIGLGAGLLIFLTLFIDIGIGAVGFIPLGIGLSQIAIWKLIDSKAVHVDSKAVHVDSKAVHGAQQD